MRKSRRRLRLQRFLADSACSQREIQTVSSNSHPITLALALQPTDHIQGREHARVTIIEYGDFECPSCKVAAPTIKMLLDQFPNQIRFVYRHFPLEDAHPHALLAAEAAEAAGAQGKFWPMHELLFRNQAHLQGKDLRRYAETLGLDLVRYTAEMDDHIYLQKVREHIDSGRRSHIRATPAFFVDGVVQDISFGMLALHKAVEAAIARAHHT
jgi:protein-disulfide isomerase